MSSLELPRKHRPQDWDEVVGQDEVVKTLRRLVKGGNVPHAIMFAGPTSGCGKTTLARILAKKLNCDTRNPKNQLDFHEINAASSRGIDMVREIDAKKGLSPVNGDCRIWLIDEGQKLTGDSQAALLKVLEEASKIAYYFICTTDPDKIIKTIHTRCMVLNLKAVKDADMVTIIRNVLEKEGKELTDNVINAIVDLSDGSPRKALRHLEEVLTRTDEASQLALLVKPAVKQISYDLVKKLVFKRKGDTWGPIAKILKDLDEEPETIRRQILGMAAKVLMDGKLDGRAFECLHTFKEPFFSEGKPALVRCCFELFMSKETNSDNK